MNEQPLVSIVTPIFNTKIEYLDKCLDSLLKQTYKNIEIICVDDCSSNYNYDYITKLSPKINLIRNESNLGCSKNAKKAFSLAKGKYIVKIDSDDYIHPTLIEKEVRVLENNPNIGAICCELRRFGYRHSIIRRPKKWSLEEALFVNMNKYGYAGGMMFRSDLLKDISIDTNYRVCEDFDFHLQILEKSSIASIHEVLYFYRSHESNIMKAAYKNNERRDTVQKILTKHRNLYKEKHSKIKNTIKQKRIYF